MAQTRPDPNAPQVGEPIVLSKFEGLKNTLKPERLGPGDLIRARNVDIDDSGQLSRRRGVTKKVSGITHSLFTASNGTTLVVLNGALSVVRTNYATASLKTGMGNGPVDGLPPVAYAQVGDNVYFSNTVANGVLYLPTMTVSAWGTDPEMWLSPVVNPTSTLPAVAGKLLGRPPLATSMAAFHGRIYLGVDSTLWATELYLYNFVDKTRGYKQMAGDITMIGSVGDGIYVGTDEGLYWLSGPTFDEMAIKRVMDSAVLPGSLVYIPGELGNPPQVGLAADTPAEVSLGFMTTNGFCVASDGGQTVNLTESKLFFPVALTGASMYRRQDGINHFVTVLGSGGTPATNSAVGDYISATLIRAADVIPTGVDAGAIA